jgi:hypothetical protein
MFELEIPNQKFDLLRYKDRYNRDSVFYEKEIINDLKTKNIKNKINKNYLQVIEGKEIKKFKKLNKNMIIILVNGYLKVENKRIELFRPFKIDINLILKPKENFSNLTKFIIINKSS